MTPVWTILIATLEQRAPYLRELLHGLLPQVDAADGLVTVQALRNDGSRPVGEYRDALLGHATAGYVCFADDDDVLPSYYVSSVLPLILDGQVDYVGWRMRCIQNGQPLLPTYHSLQFTDWYSGDRGHYRDISHLNPVRRALTAGTTFTAGWPEDRSWAAQMRGRLTSEAFIDEEMYFYYPEGSRPLSQASARPEVTSPWFSWHPDSSP